ncbi:uncharacterized protein LOC141684893 [Apium graveolens]|uniref:uncharacterized protein LOC141684893 n=1 Tax=Apium graveolens TaxID=4045 RepID=UPI003D7B2241
MSILGWNCHGLGTPWAFQFLKEIVLQKKPDFVFISEILCKQATVESFRQSVGFEGSVAVETQGHSGGIAMIWRHQNEADKKGGRLYPSQLIQGFRDVIEDCNLSDMDLIGYPFTWERGSAAADRIEVRLDRALISVDFQNMFPEAKLYNLEVSTSDHCPILLDLHSTIVGFQTKSFRFENAWLREPMCQRIVEDVWSSGRRDDESLATLREEQKKLSEIYAQQEVFWRQRSKQLWLREGDRNNKFFHASMKNRRACNHIKSLKNIEGQEVQWNNGLEEVITGYFSSLFQASNTE